MFKANVDQNLAAVLDNCPDIILVIDLLGQIVFVNKTAENELGYTSEEMKSQKINELSDVSITTFNKNHVEVESCHRQFANLLKKNGNLYPVELRYSKCSIKENEYVIAYCRKSEDGVFKDASFLINDKNFRAIARNIQGMIYREGADRSVKIITNSEFISGYKTEDFVSNKKSWFDLILDEEKGKVISEDKELRSRSMSLVQEYRIKTKDGALKYVKDYKTSLFEDDRFIGVDGIVLDNTDSKLMELELIAAKEKVQENEARLREAQKIAKTGNWELNYKNKKLHWSIGIYHIFNCNPDSFELSNKIFWKFVHPDDKNQLKKALRAHLKDRQPYNISYRIVLENKVEKHINVSYSSVFDERGELSLLKGIVTDITAQVKYQKELLRAKEKAEESDRLKTEFINTISHEVRTPMNGIMGFSEFLGDRDLPDDIRNSYVGIIQRNSKQLLDIINSILEISSLNVKQVHSTMMKVCVNEVFNEVYSEYTDMAKSKHLEFILSPAISSLNSIVVTDKKLLAKILGVLVDNAIKFTISGSVEFGYKEYEQSIQVYVQDTGIGIATENQKKIFERFVQEEKGLARQFGGLGLGLSIAKGYVDIIGGEILVDSSKGKGSTFYVNIPSMTDGMPVHTFNNLNSNIANLSKQYTILVAENEEDNFMLLEVILNNINGYQFNLIHARNGQEAVDICSNTAINMVFMDIKMPVMNGIEATKIIKSKMPDLPIIAQTAYATGKEKEIIMESGCDAFIAKPIAKNEIYDTIDKYIDRSLN